MHAAASEVVIHLVATGVSTGSTGFQWNQVEAGLPSVDLPMILCHRHH
jgi:hypothetical protein